MAPEDDALDHPEDRTMAPRERQLDVWLRTQALPSYEAYKANPVSGIALDDVRSTIGRYRR